MKIVHLLIEQWIVVVIVLALGIIGWWAYRRVKQTGRRCLGKVQKADPNGEVREKICGHIWTKRVCKVDIGDQEDISTNTRPNDFKSWVNLFKSVFYGPHGFRYWIWAVRTRTYNVCPKCGHKRLMKKSKDPLSVIHVSTIFLKNFEQFRPESDLDNIAYWDALEEKRHDSLERQGDLGNHSLDPVPVFVSRIIKNGFMPAPDDDNHRP